MSTPLQLLSVSELSLNKVDTIHIYAISLLSSTHLLSLPQMLKVRPANTNTRYKSYLTEDQSQQVISVISVFTAYLC